MHKETRVVSLNTAKNKKFMDNEVRKTKEQAHQLLDESEGFLLLNYGKEDSRVMSTITFSQYLHALQQLENWAAIYADEQIKFLNNTEKEDTHEPDTTQG